MPLRIVLTQGTFGTSRISTGTQRTNWATTILHWCAHPVANDLQPMLVNLETMFVTRHGTWSTLLFMQWRVFYQTRTSSYGLGMLLFFKWILQDSASLKTISGEINACLPLQSWYFQISIWYWHVWLQLILKQSAVLLLSDDTPHVDNKDLGEDAVLNIINNLTDIINRVFPSNYKIRRKHARSTHMIVF